MVYVVVLACLWMVCVREVQVKACGVEEGRHYR